MGELADDAFAIAFFDVVLAAVGVLLALLSRIHESKIGAIFLQRR